MVAKRTNPDIATLAGLIGAYAPYDGIFELRVPGVYDSSKSTPMKARTNGTWNRRISKSTWTLQSR